MGKVQGQSWLTGVEAVPHAFEIGQGSGREPVASCGLDIDSVEIHKIRAGSAGDGDPCLLRLSNVAPPELIEAGHHIVQGATGERQLEDVAWLNVTKSGTERGLLAPSLDPEL
jgi:hypothetical protein